MSTRPQQSINDGEEEECSSGGGSDSESAKLNSDIQFYNCKKRPARKVCPFANTERENPCPNFDQPRKRKDAIMKHLLRVQKDGGDMHHPIDDPLWESYAVKWFLSRRPPKLDPKTKKTAKQAAQSRYYKKRKRIQDNKLETMEQLFKNGDIGEEEFKKILVGEKRRQFITSRRLQAEFDQRYEREMERRVRETLERKLGELTARIKDTTQDPADIAISAAIRAAHADLNDTREALNYIQDLLFHKSEDVVQLYAHKEFLSSGTSFLEYHGFHWPTEVSSASFYLFCAMLIPLSYWNNSSEIRSRSSIRHMALRLAEHLRLEKENVEESEQFLEGIFSTFNSCCDLVTTEETKTASMSEEGRQTWLREQAQLWETAKAEFHLRFRFNSHALIQQIKVIDDLADIWRMRTAAKKDNEAAIRNAQETADRV